MASMRGYWASRPRAMLARVPARSAALAADAAASHSASMHRRDLTVSMRIPPRAATLAKAGLRLQPPLDIVSPPKPLERQSFMTRSWVACSLALAAFGLGAGAAVGLGVPAASAQNVRTMGSVVQE